MSQKLNDTIAEVTERIGGRSAAARGEYLERTGQAERTLVAVVGDHGEQFGEAGHFTHGTTLDEREVRAPLVLYWPGTLAPRRIETPVCEADLLYPPIGRGPEAIAYTRADLSAPGTRPPLAPDTPLHPDYAGGAA